MALLLPHNCNSHKCYLLNGPPSLTSIMLEFHEWYKIYTLDQEVTKERVNYTC